MVRKFLGQRICSETDIRLPASYTLTTDDLINIPDPDAELQIAKSGRDAGFVELSENGGSKLSRKFGGTVRIKQRLSSVPELLIRGMKQSDDKGDGNMKMSTGKHSEKRVCPTLDSIEMHVSTQRNKYFSNPYRAKRSLPLKNNEMLVERSANSDNNYLVMASELDYTNQDGISAVRDLQRSSHPQFTSFVDQCGQENDADNQLEDIMKLYMESDSNNDTKPAYFKKHFEYFVASFHESMRTRRALFSKKQSDKIQTDFFRPTIVSPEETTLTDLQVTNDNSDPVNIELFSKSHSSPPVCMVSSGSDQSSGEEFSDINSMVSSLKLTQVSLASQKANSEEVFHSCSESIQQSPPLLQKHFSFRRNSELRVSTNVLTADDFFGFSEEDSDTDGVSAYSSLTVKNLSN